MPDRLKRVRLESSLTEERPALQETARKYALERLPEVGRRCEEEDEGPPAEVVRGFAEMELGNVEALLVIEELAKISGAVAFRVFESCVGPVRAIEHFGKESLEERVIPAVCRGEKMIAVSMSETNAGSALTDLTTRGDVRGDASC